MQTNMRIECYIKYLNDKINSNNVEMRINISLLIQQLIILENMEFENKNIFKIIKNKIKWAKKIIFNDKENDIMSPRVFCFLERFIHFISMAINKNNFSSKKEILKWNGEFCNDEEQQEVALKDVHLVVENQHKMFFESNERLFENLTAEPGKKARLRKMMPSLKLNNTFDSSFKFLIKLIIWSDK